MCYFSFRRIKFAVPNSGTSGHILHFTRIDNTAVSQRVFMFKLPADRVRDDFHILMIMSAKTVIRLNSIIIEDTKATKAHPVGIVITGKTESMPRVEPTVNGMAPFVCFSISNHAMSIE